MFEQVDVFPRPVLVMKVNRMGLITELIGRIIMVVQINKVLEYLTKYKDNTNIILEGNHPSIFVPVTNNNWTMIALLNLLELEVDILSTNLRNFNKNRLMIKIKVKAMIWTADTNNVMNLMPKIKSVGSINGEHNFVGGSLFNATIKVTHSNVIGHNPKQCRR